MKKKFVCLMYHEIAYPFKHKFYVSPENFREQIEYLEKNGYRSIDPRRGLDSGNVLITFDDGHKSNLDAARLLSEKGMTGVFYLVKDFSLKDPEYLNEDEIKEMSRLGQVLGVHGKDHDWWTKKTEEQLVAEIDETAKWIESLTGQSVITCSAPGGRIKNREYNIIKKNLPYLKYIRNSVCSYSSDEDKMVNSMPVTINIQIGEFVKIVSLSNPYYLISLIKYIIKEFAKVIIYRIKS